MSTPILNKVRERILFLSPTVQAGWEPESKIEEFEIIKILGQGVKNKNVYIQIGAFGVVKRVIHRKSNITYAIKVIQKQMLKQTNMVEQMVNEVRIMYSLNHPYILKLFNHFEDDLSIYLVLEFAPGGQLYSVLWKQPGRKFTEKNAAKFILQLVLSLEHIHSKNIIHRDIKPENLLLDEAGNIRLADFGSSLVQIISKGWSNFLKPSEARQTFCGTLDYLAPEMLDKSHKHDQTVDIWSIGVLCFELLTAQSPFSPKENQNNQAYVDLKTRENIKQVKYSYPTGFPDGAKNLIDQILQKDSKARLSCEGIRNHQWIKDNTKDVKIPASITMELEKKQIVKSNEIDNLQKEGKLAFTQEEIYQYSRPDSIIVKEVKLESKINDTIIQKIKDYDAKFKDMDLQIKQLQTENKDLKTRCEQGQSSNQEVNQLMVKIKILEDQNTQMKIKYEQESNKNIEYQKQILDLQGKLNVANEQISQYKQKNKQQKEKEKEDMEKFKADFQSNSSMPTIKTYDSNNVTDLIAELKRKKEQNQQQ